ncbi:MAG: thiamine pyrophosphate-dependent enzyme, partial [Thermoanaerobaculia bacterium]|nr:thiamine pyrophosphate-dependent enzyme [Thermoanaerobaculia bacterium]
AEPRGPVYLSLPRETLAAAAPAGAQGGPPTQTPASPPAPDPAAIARAAELLAAAARPLIVSSASRVGDRESLGDLAQRFALPVVEFWSPCQALGSEHGMHAGFDPGPRLASADVVLVLDAPVPWIPSLHSLAADCQVIQMGPEPLFAELPLRGHRASMAVACEVEAGLQALAASLVERGDAAAARERAPEALAAELMRDREERRSRAAAPPQEGSLPRAWVSSVLSAQLDGEATVFNELGCSAEVMRFPRPGQLFGLSIAGALGWGLPAALGAQLADRDRLVVATVGDGSYVFANPVACHQTAEALDLPVLTVVFNNRGWGAVRGATLGLYPDGAAARAGRMPLSSVCPSPRFAQVVRASGGHGETVASPAELPEALGRALRAVREERRQALVDVRIDPV